MPIEFLQYIQYITIADRSIQFCRLVVVFFNIIYRIFSRANSSCSHTVNTYFVFPLFGKVVSIVTTLIFEFPIVVFRCLAQL